MFLFLTFMVVTPAFPQQTSQSTTATPAPSESLPTYPNTAQGLEKLMKDMLKLAKHGKNPKTLAAYAKSLALPDADNWAASQVLLMNYSQAGSEEPLRLRPWEARVFRRTVNEATPRL